MYSPYKFFRTASELAGTGTTFPMSLSVVRGKTHSFLKVQGPKYSVSTRNKLVHYVLTKRSGNAPRYQYGINQFIDVHVRTAIPIESLSWRPSFGPFLQNTSFKLGVET